MALLFIFCLVNADMELKPNVGSDRSWVYFTPADFADAEDDNTSHKPETLAVRFQTVESMFALLCYCHPNVFTNTWFLLFV